MWCQRIKHIINQAQNTNHCSYSLFLTNLDNHERIVFKTLFMEFQKYKKWKSQLGYKYKQSLFLQNLTKLD